MFCYLETSHNLSKSFVIIVTIHNIQRSEMESNRFDHVLSGVSDAQADWLINIGNTQFNYF